MVNIKQEKVEGSTSSRPNPPLTALALKMTRAPLAQMSRVTREASAESIVVATSPKDLFSSMAPHSSATLGLACARVSTQLKEKQPLSPHSMHLLQQCYVEDVPDSVNLLPPSYFDNQSATVVKSRAPSPSGDRLLTALRPSKFPSQWMAVNIERDPKEKRLKVSHYDPAKQEEHRLAVIETIRAWADVHHPGWRCMFATSLGPQTTVPAQSGLFVVAALKEMANKLVLPASLSALSVRSQLSEALLRYMKDRKTAESPQSDDSGVGMDGDNVQFPMDISDDSASDSASSDSTTSEKAKAASKSQGSRSPAQNGSSSKAKDPKLIARRSNLVPQLKAVPEKKLVREAVTASAQKQASARLATINGGLSTPVTTPSGKSNPSQRLHSSQTPPSPIKSPNLQLPPRPSSSFTASNFTPQSNGAAKPNSPLGTKSPPSPSTGKRIRSLFNDGPGDASQPPGKKPRWSISGRQSRGHPPPEPYLNEIISQRTEDMTPSKEVDEALSQLRKDRDTAEGKLKSARAHREAVHEEYAREMARFNRISDDLLKYKQDVEEAQNKADEWLAQRPMAQVFSPAQEAELREAFRSKAMGFTLQNLSEKERERRAVDTLLKNEIQPKCDQATAMVRRKEEELEDIGNLMAANETWMKIAMAEERHLKELEKIRTEIPRAGAGGS